MRRFKYPFSKHIDKKLLRKRIDLLDNSARQRYIANRRFRQIFGTLFWILFVFFLGIMIFLEQNIEPVIGKTLYTILVIFVSLILPALLLSYPYRKLEKHYPPQSLEIIPKDIIAIINIKLLKYYKIPENYIVTKCYDSSNQLLVDKDVLLFFHNDKLRIVNDFTSTIKDFGCYEFRLNEYTLSYGKNEDIITTEIETEKFYLSLGKRAKPFINNKGENYDYQRRLEIH
ncbi:MAG: hypothetical protein CVV60_01930 [Tenericutes bacterium HGW-Tenericutes-5]|jgi:hypothetical protein|nr:MAG: hypothetical protein CVV60_01930 [Tenericutes bacterium HGW-Tenericutes-5]